MFDNKRLQFAVIATCATFVGFIGLISVFLDSLEGLLLAFILVSGFSLIFLVFTYYAIFSAYDQERKIIQLENKVEYLKQTLFDEIQQFKNDKS